MPSSERALRSVGLNAYVSRPPSSNTGPAYGCLMQPHTLDGQTLIVVRQRGAGFDVVCGGTLSFDGEELSLIDSHDRQLLVITDEQVGMIKHVGEANRIPQCCGYDYFIFEG
jgi:hypothetical protein